MLVYLDTSALVKRYVQEVHSDEVGHLVSHAEGVGTVLIAQVEMASALGKAARQGLFAPEEGERAWRDFLSHWPFYVRLPVTVVMVHRAADLSWRHELRAYDAIYLAAALLWSEAIGESPTFVSFDHRLNQAAQKEGLPVWPPIGGEG